MWQKLKDVLGLSVMSICLAIPFGIAFSNIIAGLVAAVAVWVILIIVTW